MLKAYVWTKCKLDDLRNDRHGVTAMEYGVIAAVMIAVIASAWGLVATNLTSLMTAIAGKLVLS